MSVVSYGGVTLPYSSTTEFNQKASYDKSDTDRMYTHFEIIVSCVINLDYVNLLLPGINPTLLANPAGIMNVIRGKLLKPRQQLSMKFNGVELIPQPPEGNVGTVDAKNGPHPQYCNIYNLTNTTFLMSYHIVADYWENVDPTRLLPSDSGDVLANQPGNDVLSNRWTETMDIDGENFSTKTREGRFTIRSDNANANVADALRDQMVVVSCPNGFLRVSSQYTITPDGLSIAYKVVDREQFKMPPVGFGETKPFARAEGEYIETVTKAGGLRFGMCRVRLWGDKQTDQADLVSAALGIAVSKIQINSVGTKVAITPKDIKPNFKGILIKHDLLVDLYKNMVECRVYCQLTGYQARIEGLTGYKGPVTFTPFSDGFNENQNPPNYLPYGTADLLIQAAAYFDPDLKNNVIDQTTGQMKQGLEPGQAGRNKES